MREQRSCSRDTSLRINQSNDNMELDSANGSAFGSTTVMQISPRKRYDPKRFLFITACVVLFIGISCLIAGLVLITKWSQERKESGSQARETSTTGPPTRAPIPCFSDEMLRAGIPQFLQKVTKTYYALQPHEVPRSREPELIRATFQPYNPTAASMKALSAGAVELLRELKGLTLDRERIKLREGLLLARLEHYLQHFFGKPYENNYFSGSWMLGPGVDCHVTDPLASLWTGLKFQLWTVYKYFAPKTLHDLERVLSIIKSFQNGIKQREANIRQGVKAGMIRTSEDCAVGLICIKRQFDGIGVNNSAPLQWLPRYLFNLDRFLKDATNDSADWVARYNETMRSSLHQALIKHVQEPLAELFTYLGSEYKRHCAPRNATSGLGTSPMKYVYLDGARTGQRTNQTIETGDKIISGRVAYEKILSYYTTMDYTPDEVNQTGWTLLKALYPKAVEIAKRETGKDNETEAVAQFKTLLNSSELYLNKERFPENESDQGAFVRCNTDIKAITHCPVRYATMKKWLEQAGSALSKLEPRQASTFHFTGSKRSVPSCPVQLGINFISTDAVPAYYSGDARCTSPALYQLPFFVDRMGPKFMEWTVTGHEAFPGHHLQVQGYKENFQCVAPHQSCQYACPNDVRFLNTAYPAFSEGWATYAESPILTHDSKLYNGEALKRYGMIKSLIWRALRLVIDTGLHSRGMSRDQALQLFAEYLWEESDVAEKEISRYQATPGRPTSYMIGRQAIWKMRNATEAKLGSKFDLKDFHYHILRQGTAPLPYIERYIEKYAECVLKPNPAAQSCAEILGTTAANRPLSHVNGPAQRMRAAAESWAEDELTDSLPPVIFKF